MHRDNHCIVMASDLSVISSEVFRYSANLAGQMGSKLVVVHVVEPIGVLADAMLETYMPSDFLQEVKQKGMPKILEAIRSEVLQALADECEFNNIPPQLIDDLHLAVGDACEMIIQGAKQYNASLIVCGSGSLEHDMPTALGRNASKLLQLSHLPVVMVPSCQVSNEVRKVSI